MPSRRRHCLDWMTPHATRSSFGCSGSFAIARAGATASLVAASAWRMSRGPTVLGRRSTISVGTRTAPEWATARACSAAKRVATSGTRTPTSRSLRPISFTSPARATRRQAPRSSWWRSTGGAPAPVSRTPTRWDATPPCLRSASRAGSCSPTTLRTTRRRAPTSCIPSFAACTSIRRTMRRSSSSFRASSATGSFATHCPRERSRTRSSCSRCPRPSSPARPTRCLGWRRSGGCG